MTSTSALELPEILNIPQKLIPIIERLDDYRYFLIDGGRGSAKTQSVARLILYLADQYNVRAFCGREIQNTIEESVYTVFKDLIDQYNLAFSVGATKIDHRLKHSTIRFRGFREQGRVNIKGLEGADIVWVDEAQTITKPTLDILIPTIRKDNSKVFFTLNQYLEDDPVMVEFANRPDCLHIHIDYFDNEFCPQALITEAELCRSRNMDDYKHIWLGQPLNQANNAAFRNVRGIVGDYLSEEPRAGFDYIVGGDFARSVDFSVFSVLCVQTKKICHVERMESENKTSWAYQKQMVFALTTKYNNALFVPDSTGVGDPIVEDLRRMGVNVWMSSVDVAGLKFTNVSKEQIIERLKIAIELKLITIPSLEWYIKEIESFEVTRLPSGNYRYAAPEGKHDDGVFSLALALWGIRSEVYEKWQEKPVLDFNDQITADFWGRVKKDMDRFKVDESDLGDEISRDGAELISV